MAISTLVSASTLAEHLRDPDWAVCDCRFSLADTELGRRAYLKSHIPGAQYVHLDEDLCGEIIPGETGRHPLPEVEAFSRKVARWGIDNGTQVVVYDDTSGSIAARLWWMLRWLGHTSVGVLNGGWQAWLANGFPVENEIVRRPERRFTPRPRPDLLASTEQVLAHQGDPSWRIVDSRAPERYQGVEEPIDPVAGRIPGAINAPHNLTVGPDGYFLPADALRTHFTAVLGDTAPANAVLYCGSGVTAARNLLALAHAGLGEARLYAGSWSEWITDPSRPVEKD